ncbi:hypothetical protein ACQRIT_007163 [Beauveria bassiana]
MSISFQVFRGSEEGIIISSETSCELKDNEVFIEITHSGVCGTDELFLHSGQALGHEGVGIVRQVASGVEIVHVGDRVGFAYVRHVCSSCDMCATGHDQYCRKVRVYGECDFDVGSFGSGVVWDANHLFPIPETYESAHAAALMCAGASVWECLQDPREPARPSERVGVLGIGGLGHLAIKLASAMGCEVIALSRSETKREAAMSFGANEFHILDMTSEVLSEKQIAPVKRLLLCSTSSAMEDLGRLMPLVDTGGIIYPLGVSFGELKVPLLAVMAKGLRIQGSRRRIYPTIMTFPLTSEGIETSMRELREGRIRYKAVLYQ